ncbi:DUF308 domain-containing protein [Actinoplanes sp. NPDC051346]|uniref:HdeD family acid-resistance protein n=1 Tax=Actinoplanes sp. NPDC051346 TaxID=3155048 RepID=UPI00342D8262
MRLPAVSEHREVLRLIVGLLTIAVGVAVFAWPSATVQVIGFLFGFNLVVTGFIRAGLLLFAGEYPLLYRVVGIVFGVLTGIVGILCLRNIAGSVVLLLVVVAIGWLLDGLVEIFTAVGTPAERGSGWRIGGGLLMVLGAIAVLVWPKLGLAAFIAIGATVLVFVGIVQVLGALAGLRTTDRPHGETIPAG